MALSANQKKRGTQHGKSPADEVARTGRDSFLKRSGSRGVTREVSRPDVARTGRPSGVMQVSPSKGIGRGNADRGSDGGVKRLPDDISSV
jgi:hypothetical protein